MRTGRFLWVWAFGSFAVAAFFCRDIKQQLPNLFHVPDNILIYHALRLFLMLSLFIIYRTITRKMTQRH
ncbi:MAG: hypothetical protein JW841_07000 [Deltaproteobacteria bacterium]|nr:hypothetical protein [Deltaproteobacteria bacterium]